MGPLQKQRVLLTAELELKMDYYFFSQKSNSEVKLNRLTAHNVWRKIASRVLLRDTVRHTSKEFLDFRTHAKVIIIGSGNLGLPSHYTR